MMHSLIFPLFNLHLVNLLFYTLFCWKWSANSYVFVKWPVGQKQLDHAVVKNMKTFK